VTVEYNYLSDADDRRRLRECVRFAAEIVESSVYKRAGAELTDVDTTVLRGEALLDRWIATHLRTAYHSAGTCKMGPDHDETTVVEQYGRLRGVARLRIADISVLPRLVTRGTHATAVMIGEYVAALIRRERSAN
jgi:choline dehydrogenase